MCVFVAVSVAGYLGDAARPFRERNLVAEPLPAESGASLPTDGSTLSITDGHCSCSLYVGAAGRNDFNADEERSRYQRKGWSQSKIERAIEAKRVAHHRPGRANKLAEAFVAAVEELTIARAQLTLLASDVNSSFRVSGAVRLALGDFVSSGGMFPQSTLVSIDA